MKNKVLLFTCIGCKQGIKECQCAELGTDPELIEEKEMPYEIRWVCPLKACGAVFVDVPHDNEGNRVCPECGIKEPKK